MTATTSPLTAPLRAGDTFAYRGMVWTIEQGHYSIGKYSVTAKLNRRPVAVPATLKIGFVAWLLATNKATLNPIDRCDHCGEPFRQGARFGDGDQGCEVVARGRTMLVHVEPCGFALAASLSKTLDDILA